jgi:hypothetical protein
LNHRHLTHCAALGGVGCCWSVAGTRGHRTGTPKPIEARRSLSCFVSPRANPPGAFDAPSVKESLRSQSESQKIPAAAPKKIYPRQKWRKWLKPPWRVGAPLGNPAWERANMRAAYRSRGHEEPAGKYPAEIAGTWQKLRAAAVDGRRQIAWSARLWPTPSPATEGRMLKLMVLAASARGHRRSLSPSNDCASR